MLHVLLYYPLPLDANIIPMRGEDFVKDITECNIFHIGKLFQQTTAKLIAINQQTSKIDLKWC